MKPIPPSVVPALGITRLAIGAGLIIGPAGLGKALGLSEADAKAAGWLARLAGAREIAIGLGTLDAWRSGKSVDGWVAAQGISDASDAIAFATVALQGKVSPVRGWGMSLFALSGAVSEGLTAVALRRGSR
jgi:hypothetical protein